jgi:hypothetical protein
VQVYDSQGTLVTGATTFTAADGTYTTGGLPSGTYRVQFTPQRASADYLGEYYDDKPSLASATPIVVHAPTSLTNINAVLAKGGRIAGTVTAEDTHAGLPDVAVEVYDSGGNLVVSGATTSSGDYLTPAMSGGTYRVRFVPSGSSSQYSGEYYNDKATFASATPVAISGSSTTSGINARLSKGTQLSGHIQMPGAGNPSGVQVQVYDSSGAVVATGQTNALGFYQVAPALHSGSYRIGFVPLKGSGYIASFYHSKPTLASADVITVTAPNPRGGIDDTLARLANPPPAVYLPLIRR